MTKRKLFEDLDSWIFLGIENDIFLPQRSEYHSYIKACEANKIKKEQIPVAVLGMLLADSIAEERSLKYKLMKLLRRFKI